MSIYITGDSYQVKRTAIFIEFSPRNEWFSFLSCHVHYTCSIYSSNSKSSLIRYNVSVETRELLHTSKPSKNVLFWSNIIHKWCYIISKQFHRQSNSWRGFWLRNTIIKNFLVLVCWIPSWLFYSQRWIQQMSVVGTSVNGWLCVKSWNEFSK